jgi:hypothetical protein
MEHDIPLDRLAIGKLGGVESDLNLMTLINDLPRHRILR